MTTATTTSHEGDGTTGTSDLVSIVVPALDEQDHIAECLDSLLAQDYPEFEILVVDGCSTDGTRDIVLGYAARDPRVRLVDNPRRLTPVALNTGLAAARGRWLVRVDAHCTVPPHYVAVAVSHLRDGGYGAVGGRKDAVGTTPAGRAIAASMGSRFGQGNSVYHYGTDVSETDHVPSPAYPVDLAREAGGWNEDLPTNQDFEFDYRLGLRGERVLYDPRLRTRYYCRQSIRGLFRQYRRYGRGKVDVLRLHPQSFRWRHGAAPALVALLAAGALLGPRRPGLAAAAVAPYAAGLAVASTSTARKLDDWAARARVPAAFVAMHVGWGLGFWEGLAGRGRPGTDR